MISKNEAYAQSFGLTPDIEAFIEPAIQSPEAEELERYWIQVQIEQEMKDSMTAEEYSYWYGSVID